MSNVSEYCPLATVGQGYLQSREPGQGTWLAANSAACRLAGGHGGDGSTSPVSGSASRQTPRTEFVLVGK